MFIALLPECLLGTAALFFFMRSMFGTDTHPRPWALVFSAATVIAAVVSFNQGIIYFNQEGEYFSGAYKVDNFSRFFKLLIACFFLLALIISDKIRSTDSEKLNEFYFFITTATLGLSMMVCATEFITLFIAMEISSFPLYITASYRKGLGFQFEATAKYIVFGAVSTAVMLYGISYIYGAFGSTFFSDIIPQVQDHIHDPLAHLGIILFMAGLFYKLSAFPFHFWAPDVYAGAAAEVVAFVASLPKIAAVAFLVRMVTIFADIDSLSPILAILAVLSMTIGNLMALNQTELKRLLAYSAVSHAGYILLGLIAPGNDGLTAVLFYTVVYAVMTLAAFLVAVQLAGEDHDIPLERLSGLWQRSPVLAIMLAICCVSLAGLPPTAGFTGKLMLITGAWKAGYFWPVLFAVVNTLIGMFYYLMIIKISLVGKKNGDQVSPVPSFLIRTVAVVLSLALLFLGMLPQGLLGIVDVALKNFSS